MSEETERFDFLKVAYKNIKLRHKIGILPFNVMVVVIVYNLAIFGIFSGYGLYTFLPIFLALISNYIKYWTRIENNWILAGLALNMFNLFFDFLISVSYIPAGNGIRYTSLPTLALDVIGLFSAVYWWFDLKEENVTRLKEEVSN